MIGTRTISTGLRPAALVGLLALVATASVAAGAFAAKGLDCGNGTAPAAVVPVSSSKPAASAASADPTAAPTASPAPTATATADEPVGRDAIPLTVNLLNETGADVHVDIADNSGLLADAVSGTPRDGASVEPYTLQVENVDPRTLRLTWSDYAIPNALALYIDESARRFMLVQPEPTTDVDLMVHDRVLILTFSEPISANDVEAILQAGLDT
jgi:hypothetical protein